LILIFSCERSVPCAPGRDNEAFDSAAETPPEKHQAEIGQAPTTAKEVETTTVEVSDEARAGTVFYTGSVTAGQDGVRRTLAKTVSFLVDHHGEPAGNTENTNNQN